MNPHVLDLACTGLRGKSVQTVTFPPEWRVERLDPAGGDPLDDAALQAALDSPVGAPPLAAVAAGARRVIIAVDDHTRPTPAAAIVRLLIGQLAAAGVTRDRITVIVASGAHRPPTAAELEVKLCVSQLRGVQVVVHDPGGDLVDTGVTLGGVPVRVSRAFMDADVRIAVGGVMPHPFAAYSGGGKMVIPGLSALDVVARTHTFALMGLGGGGTLDRNRFRGTMEEAVRRIGLHWTVNVVVGPGPTIVAMVAGDMVDAHREATRAAARVGATCPPLVPLDALIVNAYPKDTEVLQMEAALVSIRRGGAIDWLTAEAPIVLSAACPHGLGTHQLFEPGGVLYRTPSRKTFLGTRPFIVHTPGATIDEARAVFWEGYPVCRTWDEVLAAVAARVPAAPRVGVLPFGPWQVPMAVSAAPIPAGL